LGFHLSSCHDQGSHLPIHPGHLLLEMLLPNQGDYYTTNANANHSTTTRKRTKTGTDLGAKEQQQQPSIGNDIFVKLVKL
jgi:hypothetical protein